VLTGAKTFAGTDPLSGSGSFQIAVVNQASGAITNVQQINVTGPTVTDMVNAINTAFGSAVASLTAGGALRLDSTVLGANLGIVVAENNSAINIATETRGFSHFFGLNNLFTESTTYANYDSSAQTSATTALNISGNLIFNLPGGGSATVAVAAGNSLQQIATAINGDGTLSAANVQARLVYDGAGYRLNVLDTDGNNFFLAGTGTALSGLGLVANRLAGALGTAVRSDIVNNPRLVSRGDVAYNAALVAGNIGIGAGDGAAARRLADVFNQNQTFPLAGGLPQLSVTLAQCWSSAVRCASSCRPAWPRSAASTWTRSCRT
jgi:flagellar hook-associated protein 1 FlgK